MAVHPATDAFMQGDRYGTIIRIHVGRARAVRVTVLLDRSERRTIFAPENLTRMDSATFDVEGA